MAEIDNGSSGARFARPHRIRFSECDPAGIVFYPQYFVLFNDLLEAWVDSLLPGGFAGYVGTSRFGLPTVRLEADFKAISRMGDDVELSLQVERLGNASMTLRLACHGADGDLRMQALQTVVATSLETHAAVPVPAQNSWSTLGVIADEVAWRDCDDWLAALVERLDQNHSLLTELLAERLPRARMRPLEATYLAWLDLRAYAADTCAVALRHGVRLAPGGDYQPGLPGHVRLNLATSGERVREILHRLVTGLARSDT